MLVAPVLRKLAYADAKAGTLAGMTQSRTSRWPRRSGSAHDPDPKTAAELAACSDDELDERFAQPLTFGTAGLRGPLRGGPNGMNLAVVLRTTLGGRQGAQGPRPGTASDVVVGRDARHGSDDFALAAAEVLAAQGFPVTSAVRRGADAGGGVRRAPYCAPRRASRSPRRTTRRPTTATRCTSTADSRSCRPPTATSRHAIADAPYADEIPRRPVAPSGVEEIQHYIDRAAHVRHTHGSRAGGADADARRRRRVSRSTRWCGPASPTCTSSRASSRPIRTSPPSRFPNPEEPGAVDALLHLAAEVDAEIAIALDPDADRCAVGVPTPDGLAHAVGRRNRLAAGRLHPFADRARRRHRSHRRGQHGGVVAHARRHRHGARRPARRDADRIQVAVARRRRPARLHAGLRLRGGDRALRRSRPRSATRTASAPRCWPAIWSSRCGSRAARVLDALDDLARRHGVHTTTAVSRRVGSTSTRPPVMARLRQRRRIGWRASR